MRTTASLTAYHLACTLHEIVRSSGCLCIGCETISELSCGWSRSLPFLSPGFLIFGNIDFAFIFICAILISLRFCVLNICGYLFYCTFLPVITVATVSVSAEWLHFMKRWSTFLTAVQVTVDV